jgi:hypothetical protein
MSRGLRFGGLVAASGICVLVAVLLGASQQVVDVIVLGAALAVGNLVELRPAERAPLPLGFAVVVVLLQAATPKQFIAVVVGASLMGVALRAEPPGLAARLLLFAEFLAEGLGAGAVYRLVVSVGGGAHATPLVVLVALGGAALCEIAVADLVTLVRDHRWARFRSRGADLALVSSGMLMAVGYGGLARQGRLGLWGPVLFSVPLIAAWYSFELLDKTRRTFRQTVEALGVAPELGGIVRTGHSARVAHLAVAIGDALGVTADQLEDLETAAWLHHLGAVSLDEPAEGVQLEPPDVAREGAEILRSSQALQSAGDIVAAEPRLHRPPGDRTAEPSALLGQILKVASAYDDLTEGDDSHAQWAVEALFTGPAYVYDGRVLSALEDVLSRRGLVTR